MHKVNEEYCDIKILHLNSRLSLHWCVPLLQTVLQQEQGMRGGISVLFPQFPDPDKYKLHTFMCQGEYCIKYHNLIIYLLFI